MSRLFPAAHMSLLALGLTVSALGASAEMMEVVGIEDGDTLNVRQGPSAASADIGDLEEHTMVDVQGYNFEGTWARIFYRDQLGWVSTAYLAASEPPPAVIGANVVTGIAADDPDGGPLPAVFTVTGVAAGDKLWVRDAPALTGARLGGLPPNSVVSINGRGSEDWGQITLNGQIGYVHMSYLTRASESGGGTTVNGFPLELTCRGTEPFWTLTIAEDRTVEYTSLIGGADPISALTQTTPATGGGYPSTFEAQRYSGTLDQTDCSDGMSDIHYSMSLILTRALGGGSETLYGCCNVD